MGLGGCASPLSFRVFIFHNKNALLINFNFSFDDDDDDDDDGYTLKIKSDLLQKELQY